MFSTTGSSACTPTRHNDNTITIFFSYHNSPTIELILWSFNQTNAVSRQVDSLRTVYHSLSGYWYPVGFVASTDLIYKSNI